MYCKNDLLPGFSFTEPYLLVVVVVGRTNGVSFVCAIFVVATVVVVVFVVLVVLVLVVAVVVGVVVVV